MAALHGRCNVLLSMVMCMAVNRNRTADMNDNIKAGPELEIIFPSEAIAQRLGALAREIANERADSLMVVQKSESQ